MIHTISGLWLDVQINRLRGDCSLFVCAFFFLQRQKHFGWCDFNEIVTRARSLPAMRRSSIAFLRFTLSFTLATVHSCSLLLALFAITGRSLFHLRLVLCSTYKDISSSDQISISYISQTNQQWFLSILPKKIFSLFLFGRRREKTSA